PAAASAFTVSGFPTPTLASVAHTFTVVAKDAYGNTATGYTGTVHVTSSDPGAALPADYTFTAFDHGVHTSSATLKTYGTQSLTATDTSAAGTSGGQASILVVQPTATLSGPTFGVRGQPLSFQ